MGTATGVKCQFQSELDTIDTVRDFSIGLVHHDESLGMPWVTQWKARMRPLQATVEVCAPGAEERVHLSVLPTTLTSSNVSGVESVPQRNEEITAPRQPGVAFEAGKEKKHAIRPNGDGKGALLEDPLHLAPEEQQKWKSLKEEFADVLNNNELPAGRPPAGRSIRCIERVEGAAPSFVPWYRRSFQDEEEIERQVDELLKKGKVQESTSAFGHNPVLARKKDGRWRMCINFKPLNKITVKQQFPMPRIDELLDRLQGSAVYSAFDFTDAFLQIPIHPDDRHKTAFHTRTRKLEFTCMPFGLVNAPAELQRQVNRDISGPVTEGWMLIYMADVLVFS